MSSKLGHVGSKTKSQGPILEKPCVCSRDHILGPIPMNLAQKFALMKFCTRVKVGHVGSKT